MKPLPIKQFRRVTIALLTVVFAIAAFSSIASAEDFRIENSTYRVEVTGQYIKEWQGQTSAYPDANAPWSTETGRVTAGFSSKGGFRFRGSKFFGDLPGSTPLPKFQFMPLGPTLAHSKNRASFKRKINYVPSCGGELGECTGDEKKGVETTARNCARPNSRIPVELNFDDAGRKPDIGFEFGQHRSMSSFCGERYPGDSTIERMHGFRMLDGLDLITGLGKGQKIKRERTRESGYIAGDNHPQGARYVKTCPEMSGTGTRFCWTTDLKVEIKRIK